MQILILHSRYLSGATSGENRVVEDEFRLLAEAGHDVRLWDPSLTGQGRRDLLRAAIDVVWSRAAVNGVRDLVRTMRPDVIHCHNLFPALSPAVVRVATAEGVPVVMTLHNYRLLCLPGTFTRDGRTCEDCLGHAPWRGVVHRCYHDSSVASTAMATSLTAHRRLGTFGQPLFLAVSEFVRAKHIEAGWDPDSILVKANFAWPTRRNERLGQDYLYLGRLSVEKGIAWLVDAWRTIPAKLVVVGDGPEAELLARSAPPNVEIRGAVAPSEVPDLLRAARAVVVPSLTYEGQPRTVLEAYSAGVPVLASRVGALPELVLDGESGLLAAPDDRHAWATAVTRLSDDRVAGAMGDRAWSMWRDRYSPEIAVEKLDSAYAAAIGRCSAHQRAAP